MKTISHLLAVVVSFLAGFIMTMILVAGSLVLFDQAYLVAMKIWGFIRSPLARFLEAIKQNWEARPKPMVATDLGDAVVIGPKQ